MSQIEQLRKQYIKDVDQMATKSRFGYFSIPPSASAGQLSCPNKTIMKDQGGKVKVEPRNIFSGLTASGVLKRSYFKYETSVYQGDLYQDPGKNQRQQQMKKADSRTHKEVYLPLDLEKTPDPKAAYEHIADKPRTKCVKDYVDTDGKVRTAPRNIMTSSFDNIERQKLKEIKHVPEPYQNFKVQRTQQIKKDMSLRGQVPFRSSSPVREQFYTYRQTYGVDQKCQGKTQKTQRSPIKQQPTTQNEPFKLIGCPKIDTFSYPEYMPGGTKHKARTSRTLPTKESFRLVAPASSMRPCPSITTLKTNILRCIR